MAAGPKPPPARVESSKERLPHRIGAEAPSMRLGCSIPSSLPPSSLPRSAGRLGCSPLEELMPLPVLASGPLAWSRGGSVRRAVEDERAPSPLVGTPPDALLLFRATCAPLRVSESRRRASAAAVICDCRRRAPLSCSSALRRRTASRSAALSRCMSLSATPGSAEMPAMFGRWSGSAVSSDLTTCRSSGLNLSGGGSYSISTMRMAKASGLVHSKGGLSAMS